MLQLCAAEHTSAEDNSHLHMCLTATKSIAKEAKCFAKWGRAPAFSICMSECGISVSVLSRLVITSKVAVCAKEQRCSNLQN